MQGTKWAAEEIQAEGTGLALLWAREAATESVQGNYTEDPTGELLRWRFATGCPPEGPRKSTEEPVAARMGRITRWIFQHLGYVHY